MRRQLSVRRMQSSSYHSGWIRHPDRRTPRLAQFDPPKASSLNYVAGWKIPNAMIAPVSAQGEDCFYSQSPIHILADVNGWFSN